MEILFVWLQAHKRRLISFGVIGGGVFLLGVGLLYVFVSLWHMTSGWAFFVQGIISVLVSYLLNWRITFGDRKPPFWRSFWRFNVSRGVTIPLNQALYMGLVWLGMEYQVANVVETAIFIAINYFISHYWSMLSREKIGARASPRLIELAGEIDSPLVSVVVPVKRSQKTIRACVDSLLNQDYAGSIEIILVGDVNDATWEALRDVIQQQRINVYETKVESPRRDANAKRNIGLLHANGPVLALTDSDMVLAPDWISKAVLLIGDGWQCVAGPMQSINHGFWPTYVDRNPLLSKTPRIEFDYVVTEQNFGERGHVPPITANVVFTREAYRATGAFNDHFTRSYEDYEYFDRMAKAGIELLCTPRLVGKHVHREGFLALSRDYYGTGWGCADFLHFNHDSRMAHKRLREAWIAGGALVCGIATFVAAFYVPYLWLLLVLGNGVAYTALATFCVARTRMLAAICFPAITAWFGFVSWIGLLHASVVIHLRGHDFTWIHQVQPLPPHHDLLQTQQEVEL